MLVASERWELSVVLKHHPESLPPGLAGASLGSGEADARLVEAESQSESQVVLLLRSMLGARGVEGRTGQGEIVARPW